VTVCALRDRGFTELDVEDTGSDKFTDMSGQRWAIDDFRYLSIDFIALT